MRNDPAISPARPCCDRQPWRVLSLLLAVPMALVLLIHPGAMLDGAGQYSHAQLMLVMAGVSAGFVHGVGFVPQLRLWRVLFSPLLSGPLMGLGYLILFKAQLG
ncbi:MAG TPA: cyd operon YbgE family protein [Pseudomonas sp.]|nr:cyd operon YbgE family protein [Pseudomonas sp.]